MDSSKTRPVLGVGCITYKRPEYIKLWKQMVEKYSSDVKIYIHDDNIKRLGVAGGSNECLKVLKDCDYIFLFNDDCFPIKKGWEDFFIDAHLKTGVHHLLYLKTTSTIRKIKDIPYDGGTLTYYDNCGGVFMFLTKECLSKVGGFNKEYGYYGYEHAGYSIRVHKAGLQEHPYIGKQGAENYIYSCDYDHHLPYNKLLKHTISMKDEILKLDSYVAYNQRIFTKDIETIYQEL